MQNPDAAIPTRFLRLREQFVARLVEYQNAKAQQERERAERADVEWGPDEPVDFDRFLADLSPRARAVFLPPPDAAVTLAAAVSAVLWVVTLAVGLGLSYTTIVTCCEDRPPPTYIIYGHDVPADWSWTVAWMKGGSADDVLVATSLPPAVWAVVAVRRLFVRRRAGRLGLCMSCGYDLRATPGRCPECGAETKTPAGAADGDQTTNESAGKSD